MASKGLKAFVIETKCRIQIQKALKQSSDLELEIYRQELLKELNRRRK